VIDARFRNYESRSLRAYQTVADLNLLNRHTLARG
jgi:hypothetical protein